MKSAKNTNPTSHKGLHERYKHRVFESNLDEPNAASGQ